jgi:hypothetical protein
VGGLRADRAHRAAIGTLNNYSFDAAAYLAQPPTHGEMEMHSLPYEVVLSTIRAAGCELLEVNRYEVVDVEMFMEFFVRRCDDSTVLAPAQR